ncbi:MAG: DUF3305 domain-containing protein [Betaproteobacteria bacterium]
MASIPRFPVHILMRRTPLASRWASEKWAPLAIEIAGVPGDDLVTTPLPPVCVRNDASGALWRFAGFALELHQSEGEGYYLNLREDVPQVFVMWRRDEARVPPVFPVYATVSYNEAARSMDGGETVDPVPLAPEIRAWVAPYIREHYRPEPKGKRRRNDPFRDGAFKKTRDLPPEQ